jgi:hypothetical protein
MFNISLFFEFLYLYCFFHLFVCSFTASFNAFTEKEAYCCVFNCNTLV